jgi:autotransporter adhesin
MTGGTQGGTAFTLANNGATLSNAATGGPMQLHGVANGTSNYDAVNFGQLKAVYGGVAAASALAGIPNPNNGNRFIIGVGYGNFMGMNSFAVGAKAAVTKNIVLTVGVGFSNQNNQTVSAGVGYSF